MFTGGSRQHLQELVVYWNPGREWGQCYVSLCVTNRLSFSFFPLITFQINPMCRLSVVVVDSHSDTMSSPGWGRLISGWLIYLTKPPTTAATILFIASVIPSQLKYQSVITTLNPPPRPPNTSAAAATELQYLLATWKQMPQVQEINKQLTFILFFLEFLLAGCRASFPLRLHLWEAVFAFNFSDWHLIFKLLKYVTARGASMRVVWRVTVSQRLRFAR